MLCFCFCRASGSCCVITTFPVDQHPEREVGSSTSFGNVVSSVAIDFMGMNNGDGKDAGFALGDRDGVADLSRSAL